MSESKFAEDPYQWVTRKALRTTLLFLLVLVVVGIAGGLVWASQPGMWGALLGWAVALIFSGTTVAVMYGTAKVEGNTMAIAILGSWLVKMIVVVVIFMVLRDKDFYHLPTFVTVLLVGAIGSIIIDLWTVLRSRVPYVDPS